MLSNSMLINILHNPVISDKSLSILLNNGYKKNDETDKVDKKREMNLLLSINVYCEALADQLTSHLEHLSCRKSSLDFHGIAIKKSNYIPCIPRLTEFIKSVSNNVLLEPQAHTSGILDGRKTENNNYIPDIFHLPSSCREICSPTDSACRNMDCKHPSKIENSENNIKTDAVDRDLSICISENYGTFDLSAYLLDMSINEEEKDADKDKNIHRTVSKIEENKLKKQTKTIKSFIVDDDDGDENKKMKYTTETPSCQNEFVDFGSSLSNNGTTESEVIFLKEQKKKLDELNNPIIKKNDNGPGTNATEYELIELSDDDIQDCTIPDIKTNKIESYSEKSENGEDEIQILKPDNISELNIEHKTEIRSEKEQHTAEIRSEKEHPAEIRSEKEQHPAEIRSEKEQHPAEMRSEKEHPAEMRSEKEQHPAEIRSEKEQHPAEMRSEKEHPAEMRSEKEQHPAEMRSEKEQHPAEMRSESSKEKDNQLDFDINVSPNKNQKPVEEISNSTLTHNQKTSKLAVDDLNCKNLQDKSNNINMENPETELKSYEKPFHSINEKENEDINDPNWNIIRKLETDEERYLTVRKLWKNYFVPDPNENLTYHGYLRRKKKNREVAASSSETFISTQSSSKRKREEDNDSDLPKGKRPRLFENLGFNDKAIDRTIQTLKWDYQKERSEGHFSDASLRKMDQRYREYLSQLGRARKEAEIIHKFYTGLPNQKTPTQKEIEEEQWDIEQVYNLFKRHYKWSGKVFNAVLNRR